MDAKEERNGKQEGIDRDEVVAKEEEAVERPKTKHKKKSWKLRILIASIISLLFCFFLFVRIFTTEQFSDRNLEKQNYFYFAVGFLNSDSEAFTQATSEFHVTGLNVRFGENTEPRDVLNFFLPQSLEIQPSKQERNVILDITFTGSLEEGQALWIEIPWEFTTMYAGFYDREYVVSGNNWSLIYTEDFKIRQAPINYIGKGNGVIIPAEVLSKYTDNNITIPIIINERISYPVSFTRRRIELFFFDGIGWHGEIDIPPFYIGVDDNTKLTTHPRMEQSGQVGLLDKMDNNTKVGPFSTIPLEDITVHLQTSSLQPSSGLISSNQASTSVDGYEWRVAFNELNQVVELEDINIKKIEDSSIFFIGIVLGVSLEVIINYLWEKDES